MLTVLTWKIPNATFTTNSLSIFTYAFSVVSVIEIRIYYLLLFTLQYPDPHARFITLKFSTLLNIQLVLFVTVISAPPLIPVLLKRVRKIKEHLSMNPHAFDSINYSAFNEILHYLSNNNDYVQLIYYYSG